MPSFDGRLPGLRQSGWSWVQVVEGSRSGSDWGKKAIRCKSRTSKRQVGFRKCDLKISFLPLYFTKHLYKELLFGTFFFSYQFLKIPHTRVTWLRLSLQTSLQPCSAALRWRRCHPLTVFFAFLTISKRFSLRATLPTAFCFDWLTQAICIQLAEQWRKKKKQWMGFVTEGFVWGFTSSALSMDMHLLVKCFETLVVVVRLLPVCWEADRALCSSHRPRLPALRRPCDLRLKRKNVQIKSAHFLKKKKKSIEQKA